MTRTIAVLLAAVSALPGQALAQSAAVPVAQTATSYGPEFFKTFSPVNALQIVERIPGFTLDVGVQTLRGFAQAAGNVVIDGQRPSSKNDTLETVLERIPASRVARVEVGPGNAYGAEYAGRPQVINVILVKGSGASGTIVGTVKRDYTGRLFPTGNASILIKRGNSTFTASASAQNNLSNQQGFDRYENLPDHSLIEYRLRENRLSTPVATLAGSWALDDGENKTAHVNVNAGIERRILTQTNAVSNTIGPIRSAPFTQDYVTRRYELGGDVTRPLAGGGLKLLALGTLRKRVDVDALSSFATSGQSLGGYDQTLADERDEVVSRLTWTRANLVGWSVEVGVEGAYNRLDSKVDLYQTDGQGVRARIQQPLDRAVVEERRGEGYLNVGRSLSTTIHFDFGAAYEASLLTITGNTSARRTLNFLKPRATLDWKPGGAWHAQASVRRTVAQLQFEDFISGTDLNATTVNGGSADLQPQRAWEMSAFVEHPLLGDGTARLEARYALIQKLQDRIPTNQGTDTPGNLGTGRRFEIQGNLNAPLGALGLKGFRLSATGTISLTNVQDPYTLQGRAFSDNTPWSYEVSLRHDAKTFAWGVTALGNGESTIYRLNEYDRFLGGVFYVTTFAEWRPDPKTTIRFEIDNLTNVPTKRRRTFYSGDRRSPLPDAFEIRQRTKHVVPSLTFKQSF